MVDVVLPVLDGREALPWVLARFPDGYRPLVVDNGSTDGSAALAQELGARVVTEPRRGFGAACWAGLTAATAEYVCFMDCDASLDPRELPRVRLSRSSGRLKPRRPAPSRSCSTAPMPSGRAGWMRWRRRSSRRDLEALKRLHGRRRRA